jgi:hypothetical protein
MSVDATAVMALLRHIGNADRVATRRPPFTLPTMPDENGYYSDQEKATYQAENCEVCGTTQTVRWYEDRKLSHMTGRGRWSKSPEMCPRPDLHPSS